MSGLKEKPSHNITKNLFIFNFLWEDNFRVTPVRGMKIRTGSFKGGKKREVPFFANSSLAKKKRIRNGRGDFCTHTKGSLLPCLISQKKGGGSSCARERERKETKMPQPLPFSLPREYVSRAYKNNFPSLIEPPADPQFPP